MARRGQAQAHTAINEGRAVKLASWEKEGDSPGPRRGPTWGEFLTGFLARDKKNYLYLVKHGSIGTPYEKRKLYANNSQKSAGSKGDWLTEDEAREWLEDNDLDEGNVGALDDFLKAHELVEGLKT